MGGVEAVVLERRLYDVPDYPPPPAIFPKALLLLPTSLCQHCSPADNQAWIRSDITLKRRLSPSVRKRGYLGVCVSDGSYVCVFKTDQTVRVVVRGKRGLGEPSESWLGADTTPPHQGLNLLRDQTHLWWAGIIISSIGQFLYYSHPSTCEIWTLVRHLGVQGSCFSYNLVPRCFNYWYMSSRYSTL